MSIEVKAKVNRDNAIFMTGESFTVSPNSLAWGCVQLHCDQILLRGVDDTQKNAEAQKLSQKKTSVPVRGKQSIHSSTPAIIFCDIRFKARELLQFEHILKLPLFLPPSFKGHFVKYSWYVSIAVQHVDAPINMLQLPIKVINTTVEISSDLNLLNEREKTNPFLAKDFEQPSIVEIASSKMEEVTSVRNSQVYEIKSTDCVFAIITIFKSFFKLGDDICGRINFPQNLSQPKAISCLQILIRVETVEVNLYGSKREENIVHQFTEHFVTAFIKETHFRVPIPLKAVPAFSTEAVQLRWRLHFEFVTSAQQPIKLSENVDGANDSDSDVDVDAGELTKLESDLNIETMAWDLYVTVHSCNPHNIGLVASVPSSSVSLIV